MKRILIVDDDVAVLDLLKGFLSSKRPMEIDLAGDGEEALEKIRHAKPDLVITDVIMPKLDGYGLLRTMKASEEWRSIPVIVLTAREMMREVFIQEGVRDFLTKPYDPEELYRAASRYLD